MFCDYCSNKLEDRVRRFCDNTCRRKYHKEFGGNVFMVPQVIRREKLIQKKIFEGANEGDVNAIRYLAEGRGIFHNNKVIVARVKGAIRYTSPPYAIILGEGKA